MSVTPSNSTEILEGSLFLGNLEAAQSSAHRAKLGITHILSVCPDFPSTDPRHLCIPVDDTESENLLIRLPEACRFIEEALKGGGRVLVHCLMGVSRSATVVAAYLMKVRKITASAALRYIKQRRPRIHPNYGFLKQLDVFSNCQYELSSTHPAYLSWKRKHIQDVTNYLNHLCDIAAIVPDRVLLSSDLPRDPQKAEALLLETGTTHFLTITPVVVQLPQTTKSDSDIKPPSSIQHLHLEIPVTLRAGLLTQLPKACEFIQSAVGDEKGTGQVLIHCATEWRACVVACAFLMWSRKIPASEATAIIEHALPLFNPNRTLHQHLQLFEQCNYNPTPTDPLVTKWLQTTPTPTPPGGGGMGFISSGDAGALKMLTESLAGVDGIAVELGVGVRGVDTGKGLGETNGHGNVESLMDSAAFAKVLAAIQSL